MKRIILILIFTALASLAFSQENTVTLSGGYAFANIEDIDVNATGWRVSGLYEFNQTGSPWAQGFSVGYLSLSAQSTEGVQTINLDVSSWPIYYAPKYLFGNKKLKGFVKGAIGWQFSKLKKSGTVVDLEADDTGFTGGGGVGAQYLFNEKIFLSAEYELLWMSNSFYKDGLLNTASLGLGIKF